MLAERRANFQCGIPGAIMTADDEKAFSKDDEGKHVSIAKGGSHVEVRDAELEDEDVSELSRGRSGYMHERDASGKRKAPPHRLVQWQETPAPSDVHGIIEKVEAWHVTIRSFDETEPLRRYLIPRWHPMPNERLGWKLEALIRYYEEEQKEVYKEGPPPPLVPPTRERTDKTNDDDDAADGDDETGTERKAVLTAEEFKQYKRLWDEMVDNAEVIYAGLVDDVRDTDNAWNETTVLHFEISEDRNNEKLGEILDRLP